MTKPFDTQNLCGWLDEERGYNMNTCSGLPVWPKDPQPEDIRIEDIAGALSRICRYNGHLKDYVEVPRLISAQDQIDGIAPVKYIPLEIYSVAQHSVLVEEKVRQAIFQKRPTESDEGIVRDLLLAALLHDAHEYVLGDMIKPQKTMYGSRKKFETAWDFAIAERFGFDPGLFDHPAIKEADYRMFLTEKRDLVNCVKTDFGTPEAEPYPERIVPVLPSKAREMFMQRFNELYQGE